MNICVVTIFNELNYGAYLQAYALKKYLTEQGHSVEFYKKEKWSAKDSLHALHLRKPAKLPFHYKLLKSYMKDWKHFVVTKNLTGYDAVIIGSDELWNVRNYNFSHDTYYIGIGVGAHKCLTYAVSCNNCTVDEFSKQYPEIDNFYALDGIAVRDKNTYDLVTALSTRTPKMVLDPTFLTDYEVDGRIEKEDYILIYGYYFTEEEINSIRKYISQYSGIKTIAVGFIHNWCDKNIACGPLEFLNYVKYARCVITSTFHGTVFSIIFRKNFVTFGRNNLKISDLLRKFSLENRNATGMDVQSINPAVIYNDEFESTIHYWKSVSCQYLTDLLKE